MISAQPTDDLFHDEPPFLLFDEFDLIPETASFLRQLLLKGISVSTLRAYAYDLHINLSLEDVSDEYHRAMDELSRIDANEKS